MQENRGIEKNVVKQRVTEIEVGILKFINEFGFCEAPHVWRNFCLARRRTYHLMSRLIGMGLITHQRIFHLRHGVYFLTREGAAFTNLSPISMVPVGHYEHQLKIINVYLHLKKLHPEARWVSERRLKQEKFVRGVGERGHVADGLLVMPDQTKVAIEVELTQKGRFRLEKILKGYGAQFDVKEVWYYCAPDIVRVVTTAATKLPFIKIFNIEEFLNEQST